MYDKEFYKNLRELINEEVTPMLSPIDEERLNSLIIIIRSLQVMKKVSSFEDLSDTDKFIICKTEEMVKKQNEKEPKNEDFYLGELAAVLKSLILYNRLMASHSELLETR